VTAPDAAFELRGVAHLIQRWGEPATDLETLRRGIESAPDGVLFYHAVQYQLRHPGAEELPPDDFSAWIGGVVQDWETAERLLFAVQGPNPTAESMRASILGVLNAVPEKRRPECEAPEGSEFVFLSSTSVSFPIGTEVRNGQETVDALLAADPGVWFFHLIEDPWLRGARAPLPVWLESSGFGSLAGLLEEAAASALPIDKGRLRVRKRWQRSRIGRRLTDATLAPERDRREAGREAVARLVRRRLRSGDAP
jgi:hypothetical protein